MHSRHLVDSQSEYLQHSRSTKWLTGEIEGVSANDLRIAVNIGACSALKSPTRSCRTAGRLSRIESRARMKPILDAVDPAYVGLLGYRRQGKIPNAPQSFQVPPATIRSRPKAQSIVSKRDLNSFPIKGSNPLSSASKSANLSRSASRGELGRYSGDKWPIRVLESAERVRAPGMPVKYRDGSQEG